jgi:hypothetical protein
MMALEKEAQRQPSLLERPRPLAARTRAVGDNDHTTADVETGTLRSGGAIPQDQVRGKLRVVDLLGGQRSKPSENDRGIDDELRRRLRRQDVIVLAIGLLLLAVAAALTCLYWNYARPFPSTDDAFIAARQIPVPTSRRRGA